MRVIDGECSVSMVLRWEGYGSSKIRGYPLYCSRVGGPVRSQCRVLAAEGSAEKFFWSRCVIFSLELRGC